MRKFKINYDKMRVAVAVARQNLETYKRGGGFIYATSHSIMPQAKFENYQAMLDVLREHGKYDMQS